MNDRELMELAAKAAGHKVRWHENWQCFVHAKPHNIDNPPTMAGQRLVWVPLEDDGDALRLAVKLQMDVLIWEEYVAVSSMECAELDEDALDGCIYAATRRAIVRAAAAIGRDMP